MRSIATIFSATTLLAIALIPTPASADPAELGPIGTAITSLQNCLTGARAELCQGEVQEVQDALCLELTICLVCLDFEEGNGLDLQHLKMGDLIDPKQSGSTYIRWFGYGVTPESPTMVPGMYLIRTSWSGEVVCLV